MKRASEQSDSQDKLNRKNDLNSGKEEWRGGNKPRREQTEHDISRGTHHVISPSRPSPAFRTASDKSWAWRPGNEAICRYCRSC